MSLTTLAILFGNPLMLWWGMAAVVPIVLHLLYRRRHGVEPWAAMRLLKAAMARRRHRVRLEAWLHVLIRTCLLLLIALALADPMPNGEMTSPIRDQPVHRLILLDATLSTARNDGGGTLFDELKATAIDVVNQSRGGDSFQLVVVRGDRDPVVVRRPTSDRAAMLQELESLDPSFAAGEWSAALDAGASLLKLASHTNRREAIILSDFQSREWLDLPTAAIRRRAAALDAVAREATMYVLPPSEMPWMNLAVTSVDVDRDWIFTGVPFRLTADVTNFSDQPAVDVAVDIYVDGALSQAPRLSVPAGESRAVTVDLVTGVPGEHAIEVRLGPDSLAGDNQRWRLVQAHESIRVLVVEGASEQARRSAADYLRLVFNSVDQEGETTEPQRGRYRLSRIDEHELGQQSFTEFDCVFLCNVGYVANSEARRLESFVSQGGGLIISLGDQVSIEEYEERLGTSGLELLPGRIAGWAGGLDDQQNPEFFVSADPEHPVLRPFEGHPEAGLSTTRIYRYALWDNLGTATEVPVRLTSGAPLLLDTPRGRGRVMVVGTTLDDSWGSWVVWPSFVPMMHEAVKHVARGRAVRQPLTVGETLTLSLPDVPADAVVSLISPNEMAVTGLQRELTNSGLQVASPALEEPGVYSSQVGAPLDLTRRFAVNVPTEEGDLSLCRWGQLSETYFQTVRVRMLDGVRNDRDRWINDVGREPVPHLATPLLTAAACLLVVDVVLGWNVMLGVALLASAFALGVLNGLLPEADLIPVGVVLALGICALALFRQRRRMKPSRPIR